MMSLSGEPGMPRFRVACWTICQNSKPHSPTSTEREAKGGVLYASPHNQSWHKVRVSDYHPASSSYSMLGRQSIALNLYLQISVREDGNRHTLELTVVELACHSLRSDRKQARTVVQEYGTDFLRKHHLIFSQLRRSIGTWLAVRSMSCQTR